MTAARRSYAPTERQLGFLYRLAGERKMPSLGTCGEERIENMGARVENHRDAGTLDGALVSSWIDWLMAQPYDRDEEPELVGPGVYELPTGEIFVVKQTRDKKRVYAKKLIEINGDRLNHEGAHVNIDFEYAPGAIKRIREEHRMSVERAKALTIRYGRCINCGRGLKVAKSVEQGIGPVCIKAFGPIVR